MGSITHEIELKSSLPAAKIYKAFVLDADTLFPKVLPQAIKSVETLEGDGGVGTIKLTTFGEGSQYKSMKHKVDEIDKEKFLYKYTIIEGDVLGDVLESISYTIKVEEGPNGGSICKNTSIYNTKKDAKINEEELKAGKEKASGLYKALEAYLVANPDY